MARTKSNGNDGFTFAILRAKLLSGELSVATAKVSK